MKKRDPGQLSCGKAFAAALALRAMPRCRDHARASRLPISLKVAS